jgi:hypothetical protein
MPGARKAGLALLAAAGLYASLDRACRAEEFANILVPAIEDRSREASAQALGAASLVLKGFQSRELRQSGNEKEAFSTAARDFREAAGKFDALLSDARSNPELNRVLGAPFNLERDVPERDRPALRFWLGRTGTEPGSVKTKADLFAAFARDTRRLGEVVGASAGQRDPELFRRVTDDLSLYLRVGAVLATLTR